MCIRDSVCKETNLPSDWMRFHIKIGSWRILSGCREKIPFSYYTSSIQQGHWNLLLLYSTLNFSSSLLGLIRSLYISRGLWWAYRWVLASLVVGVIPTEGLSLDRAVLQQLTSGWNLFILLKEAAPFRSLLEFGPALFQVEIRKECEPPDSFCFGLLLF